MPESRDLRRVLTATHAAWIVAGSMVGAGIFITPGLVAEKLPGVVWPMLAWLLGGAVALAGALVYGELGARLPEAGGDYRYIEAAYGRLPAFVNGWAAITLTFSAAAAAQTRSALDYFPGTLLGPDAVPVWAAPAVVVVLTWANMKGARIAGKTTIVLTSSTIAILLGIFVFGVVSGSVDPEWPATPLSWPSEPLPIALGAALVPIFFTYSGWNAAAYLGGEMRDATRGIARGLVLGTGAVTLLYLLVNGSLLLVLPQDVLAGSTRPVAEAVARLLGPRGETLLAVTIAAAICSSANVALMAGARVYWAMARDGMAPAFLYRANDAGVPSTALWVGGAWSAGLSMVPVQRLVEWATLAILLLSSIAVTSLFVLRRRAPAAPFRCPGYPFTPALYLVAALGAASASLLFAPRSALVGLGIVLLGAPLYFVFRPWFGPPEDGRQKELARS